MRDFEIAQRILHIVKIEKSRETKACIFCKMGNYCEYEWVIYEMGCEKVWKMVTAKQMMMQIMYENCD